MSYSNYLIENLRGKFAKNVLTLTTGAVVAQIIVILITPILTRLYSPEDFGVTSIYMSFVAILSAIACLRYELAIVLPQEDKEAENVFLLSILISFVISGIILFFIFLFSEVITYILKVPEFSSKFWLTALGVLCTGLYNSLFFWNIRKKKFNILLISRITQAGVNAVISLGAGLLTVGFLGLIIGQIGGQIAAFIVCCKSLKKNIVRDLNFSDIIYSANKYKRFPFYLTWGALLNSLSLQLTPVFLSSFFTPMVAGYYLLGFRILTFPLALLGRAIGQVFFQKASEEKKNIPNLVKKVFLGLVIISIIPFMILFIFGPKLFVIVFGSKWFISGKYVQILSPIYFVQFIVSPLSMILIVLEKQKTLSLIQLLLAINLVIPLVIGGIYLKNPISTLYLLSIFQTGTYLIYLYLILKNSKTL